MPPLYHTPFCCVLHPAISRKNEKPCNYTLLHGNVICFCSCVVLLVDDGLKRNKRCYCSVFRSSGAWHRRGMPLHFCLTTLTGLTTRYSQVKAILVRNRFASSESIL